MKQEERRCIHREQLEYLQSHILIHNAYNVEYRVRQVTIGIKKRQK